MENDKAVIQVMTALKNPALAQPYQLANLAFEIVKIKNYVSNNEFLFFYQLFAEKIEQNNEQEILDDRLCYAVRIMESDKIDYEELVKLYSVLQECYALKTLDLEMQNDLSEFYEILQKTSQKYAKSLNEIEQKFFDKFLLSFNYREKFLD